MATQYISTAADAVVEKILRILESYAPQSRGKVLGFFDAYRESGFDMMSLDQRFFEVLDIDVSVPYFSDAIEITNPEYLKGRYYSPVREILDALERMSDLDADECRSVISVCAQNMNKLRVKLGEFRSCQADLHDVGSQADLRATAIREGSYAMRHFETTAHPKIISILDKVRVGSDWEGLCSRFDALAYSTCIAECDTRNVNELYERLDEPEYFREKQIARPLARLVNCCKALMSVKGNGRSYVCTVLRRVSSADGAVSGALIPASLPGPRVWSYPTTEDRKRETSAAKDEKSDSPPPGLSVVRAPARAAVTYREDTSRASATQSAPVNESSSEPVAVRDSFDALTGPPLRTTGLAEISIKGKRGIVPTTEVVVVITGLVHERLAGPTVIHADAVVCRVDANGREDPSGTRLLFTHGDRLLLAERVVHASVESPCSSPVSWLRPEDLKASFK